MTGGHGSQGSLDHDRSPASRSPSGSSPETPRTPEAPRTPGAHRTREPAAQPDAAGPPDAARNGSAEGTEPVGVLIEALRRWITELLPDAERGRRLIDAVRAAAPDPTAALDGATCERLAEAARNQSRHLELEYVPDGSLVPDETSPGWDPPDPVDVRMRAGAVTRVTRSADGVATITLDGLEELALAAPYIDAAFALVRGCRGLVLDLRRNRGGDPATAALVVGWLLGGVRVQLSTVVYAGNERQWWTPGLRADRQLAGTPVAVLTSGRTFSSAEALTYHLQARKRCAVIGEQTGGAADHITPITLTRHVRGFLPHAYVLDARTGTNWEGAGVRPDIACPAEEAPARAHALLTA